MYRPAARSVLLALAALAAPSAIALNPDANEAPALTASTAASTIPTPQQVFAIPPAMLDMLHTQVTRRSYSREQRLQALVEMIFDRHGMDLQYDADATLTVSEIWQQRRANCLA